MAQPIFNSLHYRRDLVEARDVESLLRMRFPDATKARMIAASAALDITVINWASSPLAFWANVLDEAARIGALAALLDAVDVALCPAPKEARIRAALAGVRQVSAANGSLSPARLLLRGDRSFLGREMLRDTVDELRDWHSPAAILVVRGNQASGRSETQILLAECSDLSREKLILLHESLTFESSVRAIWRGAGLAGSPPAVDANPLSTESAVLMDFWTDVKDALEAQDRYLWILFDDVDKRPGRIAVHTLAQSLAICLADLSFQHRLRLVMLGYPAPDLPRAVKHHLARNDATGTIDRAHVLEFVSYCARIKGQMISDAGTAADHEACGADRRVVAPGLFLTARTVAERFAVGIGHEVRLIEGRAPWIDLQAEGGRATDRPHRRLQIGRVVLIHPYWDCVILEVVAPDEGTPVVVAHPWRSEQESALVAERVQNAYDIKRLMPGNYRGRQLEASFGNTVSAGLDDVNALGSDFGAPVFDLSGQLLGVRFASQFLVSSRFVPAWEQLCDPAVTDCGIGTPADPQDAAAWVGAWQTLIAPSHNVLLDAYVVRATGDIERAQALLADVEPNDPRTDDRELLLAACELEGDRQLATQRLHRLIDAAPQYAWNDVDLDALVATRLRLAVDAEAELAMLQLQFERPALARLVRPEDFRVIAPPMDDLPWRRGPSELVTAALHSDLPQEALAVASRIVEASQRCEGLQRWTWGQGAGLAHLDNLLARRAGEARELAASYVAFPLEMVRASADYLLETTGLAPHPRFGWTPLVNVLARWRASDGHHPPPDGATRRICRTGCCVTAEPVHWQRCCPWRAGVGGRAPGRRASCT